MARSTKIQVNMSGNMSGELPEKDILSLNVERDIDQPDLAEILVAHAGEQYAEKCAEGDKVEVKIAAGGGSPETVFKGEVVGIEPTYEAKGDTRFVIRAYNQLHRLVRGRKSKTYEKMSDQDIVQQIAGNASLSAQCDSDTKIKHPHVYQHNQTDLEFLRSRAARIDYEVLCEDTTLYFRKRQVDKDSGIELELTDPSSLQRFSARLSSATIVQEVNVRAWDPDKKKEIVGKAKASGSRLGGKAAGDAVKKGFGKVLTFETEYPVFSQEEADALAKSALDSRLMSYITADAQCMGDPKYKPGTVLKVKVPDKRFSGKYYVTAVHHRYFHGQGLLVEEAGYRTLLRLQRDSEGAD